MLEAIAVQAKERQGARNDLSGTETLGKQLPNVSTADENKTAHKAAEMFGTNRTYVNEAKKAGGAPSGNNNAVKQLDQNDPVESRSTADTLAEQYGTSPATVKRAGKAAESVDDLSGVRNIIFHGK